MYRYSSLCSFVNLFFVFSLLNFGFSHWNRISRLLLVQLQLPAHESESIQAGVGELLHVDTSDVDEICDFDPIFLNIYMVFNTVRDQP